MTGAMKNIILPWRCLPDICRATARAFDAVMEPPSVKRLAMVLLALLAVWHVYVP